MNKKPDRIILAELEAEVRRMGIESDLWIEELRNELTAEHGDRAVHQMEQNALKGRYER